MALTNPTEGEIIVDGHKGIKAGSILRSSVSCILQDFAQYQMTIRENIEVGYANHKFTEDEIWSLLNKVGLKEIVEKLPKGIDTELGQLQKGMELSKGQWQRLAIARLLANPNATLWILDEPTAYLDPISEIEIYDMIYDLAGDRTVLFISHRLGFAKRADRIIVFNEGKVVEEGIHRQLLNQDGIYAEMYRNQESWYVA
jgi:ATP-binding cassette subfamily B protein